MKKEINELLNSESAILTLNQYCFLRRYQCNNGAANIDTLRVEFNLTSKFSHSYDIRSRDWRGIIEEVAEYQAKAFADACETLNKQLLNGYIG